MNPLYFTTEMEMDNVVLSIGEGPFGLHVGNPFGLPDDMTSELHPSNPFEEAAHVVINAGLYPVEVIENPFRPCNHVTCERQANPFGEAARVFTYRDEGIIDLPRRPFGLRRTRPGKRHNQPLGEPVPAPNLRQATVTGECAVCLCDMDDPVHTDCNHAFCRECITLANNQKQSCPLCRAPLSR